MFADASAIIAVLAKEKEYPIFRDKLNAAKRVLVSPLAIYEASLGLARVLDGNLASSSAGVRDRGCRVRGARYDRVDLWERVSEVFGYKQGDG